MFRRLRLWDDGGPVIIPSRPPLPLPMITYGKGLPSLPDDIIYEIFSLLDAGALKSCSLTGKVVSRSAKPLLHRTLYLIPRNWPGAPTKPSTPGHWNELKGLATLGEHGLLQHARHASIYLSRNPLFPHDLQPHVQHLRSLTNLRSLKTRWLDIPSFIPKMEEYFGAFFESLQSLELESLRGDYHQILYFVCQFPNLRDLKIKGLQDHTHAMRNGGPHPDIETSPLLDGTLDLQLDTEHDRGAPLVLDALATLPSGLRFRTLKLSGCISQLLVDACAPTLECIDFWFGRSFLHGQERFWLTWLSGGTQYPQRQLSFKRHPILGKLEIKLADYADTELVATWLSEMLSTITSNVFTELTICIARVSFMFHTASEDQVRGWNSVDNVLDRLSLCEDVTLVIRLQHWVIDDKLRGLVERYFPLMWDNGRIVLEGPIGLGGGAVRRMRTSGPGEIF